MSIIRRDDHIQFVVGVYRERFSSGKPILLRRRLSELRPRYGEFCRVQPQKEHEFSLVVAREPGYLLAETIHQYFGHPSDMVYCEALSEGEEALLIVILGDQIVVDARLSRAEVAPNLWPFIQGSRTFSVYVYGSVPLVEYAPQGDVAFPRSRVLRFVHLDRSPFLQIPVLIDYQLTPMDIAEYTNVYLRGRGRMQRLATAWHFSSSALVYIFRERILLPMMLSLLGLSLVIAVYWILIGWFSSAPLAKQNTTEMPVQTTVSSSNTVRFVYWEQDQQTRRAVIDFRGHLQTMHLGDAFPEGGYVIGISEQGLVVQEGEQQIKLPLTTDTFS